MYQVVKRNKSRPARNGNTITVLLVSFIALLPSFSLILAARPAEAIEVPPITAGLEPDTTAPTVEIQAPTEGELYTDSAGTVTVKLLLQDNIGVSRFHIDVDGTVSPSMTSLPASDQEIAVPTPALSVTATFNVADLSDAPHVINVSAADAAGNSSPVVPRGIFIDRTAPSPALNITEGQQISGTVGIVLSSDEKNPASYRISILDSAGSLVREHAGEGNVSGSLEYDWDTTRVANGSYSVRGTVTDIAGRTAEIARAVTVNNQSLPPEQPVVPTLTIDPTVGNRTVTGTVSDPNASFAVMLDDVNRGDIVVTVGVQREDGSYEWSLILPASIGAGEHTISVTASANGQVSAPAVLTFTIPFFPEAATTDSSDPLLQLLSENLTEPFTVPNSFGIIPVAATKSPAIDLKSAETSVLQNLKDPDTDRNVVTTPVAATSAGWKLFGFYWYWWALISAGLVSMFVWVRAFTRRRNAAKAAIVSPLSKQLDLDT